METKKEELLKNLDLKFQDIHPGGEFLRQIMVRIIEGYNPNWENQIEIRISKKDSKFFVERGPEALSVTERIFSNIGLSSNISFVKNERELIVADIFIQ